MPRLLVILNPLVCGGGIEAWMRDLFPRMASKNWTTQFSLTRGRWDNNAQNVARRNEYIGEYRLIDGIGGTPRSRQHEIIRELRKSACDVLMPIMVGDVLPAFRQYRHSGGDTRICFPVHTLLPSVLADIANNADIIDVAGVVNKLLYCWAAKTLPSMQVRLIRNGAPPPIVDRRPASSRFLRVGFVGRLESEVHKRALDIVPILHALKRLGQRISLKIIGDGASQQAIAEHATRFAGFHNIQMHGWMTRERLYSEIYPNLDCLLLTSAWEGGQPIVLIEAMLHGVVPVSSRFGGHAVEGLLAHERNCLTFPVGDAKAAAECLQRFSDNPDMLANLSLQAISSASTYDQESMAQGWIDAFWAALEGDRRAAVVNGMPGLPSYGRLDQLRLPISIVDLIRRLRRKGMVPNSAWDEWPGTLNYNKELEDEIWGQLDAIEPVGTAPSPCLGIENDSEEAI